MVTQDNITQKSKALKKTKYITAITLMLIPPERATDCTDVIQLG